MKRFLSLASQVPFASINHFHMVLADPYYRWAAADFLFSRIATGFTAVQRTVMESELVAVLRAGTSAPSVNRVARNLLTSLRDNGYLVGSQNKEIHSPRVDATVLGWMMYALAEAGQGANEFDGSPVFRSLLKPRELLVPEFSEGERRGWWDFVGDRNRLAVHLKYRNLTSWLEALA